MRLIQSTRSIASWTVYPATVVGAFVITAALLSTGLPILPASYAAVVIAAGAVTLFEFVIPYDKAWQPLWTDVKNDLLFMVAVQMVLPQLLGLLLALTLLGYLEPLDLPLSDLWPRTLPLFFQVALMLVVAELLRYPLHVAAHNTKILWRLHAVHHSPKKLYWLNVGRFHPVEKALQYSLDTVPFILIGVGAEAVALYFVFYAVNGFYQHSNVDVRYGLLNYLVSGPELHRWHHSKLVDESNRNYGNNLIVWDLVFGTWFLPRSVRVGDLGLKNRDYPLDFLGQMTAPLTPGLDKKPPSKGS
ncbi:MAG TPA: fatty acid hydroxylase family protein [Acidobacteria bacterium]|jgi:sterol desaturase/sphingolipid hydroxylase (fatty acid hydroxylase superfamily)|nr:fatty acid hydroxylase family protein [Acidobacteriota bacterium]